MNSLSPESPIRKPFSLACGFSILLLLTEALSPKATLAETMNLLQNPGFEEIATGGGSPPSWEIKSGSAAKPALTDKEAHGGRHSLQIPKSSAIEQSIKNAAAGSYLARCWVKSEADQRVTFILQDAARPWAAYTYSDIPISKGEWTPIEVFCALDQDGTLTLSIGAMSKEFRTYHGTESEMTASILVDDLELIRRETIAPRDVDLWDSQTSLNAALDLSAKATWLRVEEPSHGFLGDPIFQIRQLTGMVRKGDGGLTIYALQDRSLKPRGTILPSPAFKVSKCAVIKSNQETGIQVSSEDGKQSYIAWLAPAGMIRIDSAQAVPEFKISGCRIRHGILPSFVGADICYSSAKLSNSNQVHIPSTQWFVGLEDGNDSMMVAVWDSGFQDVSIGLSGSGAERVIDSLSINTEKGGFALSFIEHPGIWHQESLQEDWLGEYVPIGWKRPFPARWMARFFVTPGGQPSFQQPYMDYSFPIANTKTRLWGVWFEDWNHYPAFFDGSSTVLHFEKSFIPNGDALIYFLEPAGADLLSPAEIVQMALGKQKAAALLDLDGNKIRKLNYSTPDDFMYDRPVCATTTRLSQIKKEEKPTVGVNLATHLYEFIRGIRGRVDQYSAFFAQMRNDLSAQKAAHKEMETYVNELESIVIEAESKSQKIYSTPLSTVETKIEGMKKLLREGGGDGFDCGTLDVRSPAGAQDDLCRRYNRSVLRLMQTAAMNCGDSTEKAALAKHIWTQSRLVLREPTRWEPRRTLYFSEP